MQRERTTWVLGIVLVSMALAVCSQSVSVGDDDDASGEADAPMPACYDGAFVPESFPVCTAADGDSDTDADSDSDTDIDSDADSDSDTDIDSDADSDGDGDVDAGADGDGDGDADSDADSDTDTDADGDSDGDVDGDGDVHGDADLDADDGDADGSGDGGPPEEPECDTENEVVLYLSADDSNSMASPVIARAMIRANRRIDRPMRVYEFLNYYSFGYEADCAGVRVSAQMRARDDGESYDLQIGVRAPNQTSTGRRPLNLTLSLDTSASMLGRPIGLVRRSCLALAGALRDGDIISMVTWDDEQAIILRSHHVSGPCDSELVRRCNELAVGGSTDLNAGLQTAYGLARRNFRPDRINRVILMSDGGANTGETDIELIAQNADDAEGESIYLMGVGMSDLDGYRDDLMNAVTDAGKGSYIFIDSTEEARLMFGERFLSNVELAARDVRVELTLPPTFAMRRFHGEQHSTTPREVEPQHLAPNDAMIYHQVVRSCAPSELRMDSEVRVVARYHDPFTREPQSDSIEASLEELLDGDDALLLKGNAIVAYAGTLEQLRSMRRGREALTLIDETLADIESAMMVLTTDPDLAEIHDLLSTYREVFE